jgi:transcriptional regulator with XRE-family HTH domain
MLVSPQEPIPQDFGGRLRYARERTRFKGNQAAFGAEVAKLVEKKDGDYTQGTVSRWEKNDMVPTFEAFVAIVKVLECSSDFLLGLTENRSRQPAVNPGDWIADEKKIEQMRENPGWYAVRRNRWAWPVPRQYVILSPTDYADLESELLKPRQPRRKSKP